MLTYKFIDRPSPITRQLYDETIACIVNKNKQLDGLKAIYKFGNITTPGISDLDLIFVFENGVTCLKNGFESLPKHQKVLFTHGIMAISEKHFTENTHFNLWSDQQLLFGSAPSSYHRLRTQEEERSLSVQTAIEYIIINYIDLKIQNSYKVIKIRSLLQHMKGLLYDLQMLNDSKNPISSPLLQLKQWIQFWFQTPPSDNDIREWVSNFGPQFDAFIQETLIKSPLFLPEMERYVISKNMKLWKAEKLDYSRTGILLPSMLSLFGRNYFKLQHKLNRFDFYCPITHNTSEIVKERFEFLKRMKVYNREHLPNFMTMISSLTAKVI